MDFGNVVASCREYTFSRAHPDSDGKFWSQRLVLFLISKLSVATTFMDSRFRSLRHLKVTPKFGWSCPAAQISTWSYDTKNQKNLGEVAQESAQDQDTGQKTIFL